jgi:hypothetical protein
LYDLEYRIRIEKTTYVIEVGLELNNRKNVGETHLVTWYIRFKKSFVEYVRQGFIIKKG